mgnify:CR=1 FL=1
MNTVFCKNYIATSTCDVISRGRDEDLDFSVVEVDRESVCGYFDAVACPEQVAEFGAESVGVVGDLTLDLRSRGADVGGGEEEVASGEGVELVVYVAFDLRELPDGVLFPPRDDLG